LTPLKYPAASGTMRKLLILPLLLLALVLQWPTPNVQAAPSEENTAEVPTDREVRKLAQDSLLLFNVAIQTKSFDNFYSKIAQFWQEQTTPADLLRIFRSFTEQNVNIAPIIKEKPNFDQAPTVNADGILVLKGSYATQPNNLSFELKYVSEDESWKLMGINVQLKPASDAPAKKDKEKKAKDSEEEEEPPSD
jgi:hypothetical protein